MKDEKLDPLSQRAQAIHRMWEAVGIVDDVCAPYMMQLESDRIAMEEQHGQAKAKMTAAYLKAQAKQQAIATIVDGITARLKQLKDHHDAMEAEMQKAGAGEKDRIALAPPAPEDMPPTRHETDLGCCVHAVGTVDIGTSDACACECHGKKLVSLQ